MIISQVSYRTNGPLVSYMILLTNMGGGAKFGPSPSKCCLQQALQEFQQPPMTMN